MQDEVRTIQNEYRNEFQQILDILAGTRRETFAENKELLDAVQLMRKRLSLAFRFNKGRSNERVNVQLASGTGSVVGTFSVFTTKAERKFLYNGPEFPSLKVFDPLECGDRPAGGC